MKLIAAIAIAIAAPQTSYTQHTRPQDVNVVNTPNVNALQGGAWSVGINPSSNTVLVASSSREPVSHNADASAGQHFPEADGDRFSGGSGPRLCLIYGTRRQAPRHRTGLRISPYGRRTISFLGSSVRTTANNNLAEHLLYSFLANGPLQFPVFTLGNATIYADPGSTVELIYKREGNYQPGFGTSELNVTFSGHYIVQ